METGSESKDNWLNDPFGLKLLESESKGYPTTDPSGLNHKIDHLA
jgi:hypothetical protein